jgi:hypothetical protein
LRLSLLFLSANDTNVTRIQLRLADGKRCQRRFLKSDSVQTLYDFVQHQLPEPDRSKGFFPSPSATASISCSNTLSISPFVFPPRLLVGDKFPEEEAGRQNGMFDPDSFLARFPSHRRCLITTPCFPSEQATIAESGLLNSSLVMEFL